MLYLGDHDPSGKNIEEVIRREITNRLSIGSRYDADDGSDDFDRDRIKWSRVASTEADLDTYSGSLIPCKKPNPKTKKGGDTRTPAYMAKYGDRCLQVDAIDNVEIVSRLEKAILRRIDKKAWDAAKQGEAGEREKLKKAINDVSKQF